MEFARGKIIGEIINSQTCSTLSALGVRRLMASLALVSS